MIEHCWEVCWRKVFHPCLTFWQNLRSSRMWKMLFFAVRFSGRSSKCNRSRVVPRLQLRCTYTARWRWPQHDCCMQHTGTHHGKSSLQSVQPFYSICCFIVIITVRLLHILCMVFYMNVVIVIVTSRVCQLCVIVIVASFVCLLIVVLCFLTV